MNNHLYIVVDVLDEEYSDRIHRGSLVLWRWRGWYYTMQIIDLKTSKVKPLANIVWLKKLSVEEVKCVARHRFNECFDRDEIMELARKQLETARKSKNGFPHLTEKDIEEILGRIEKLFEVRDDEGGSS